MMKLLPFFSHTNDQNWAAENISQNSVQNTSESMNIKSKIILGILHNHITQNLQLELSLSYPIFLWY